MPYMEYVDRISRQALARTVKLADLEDNMNLFEIPKMTEKDAIRAKKYHAAWKLLKASEPDV